VKIILELWLRLSPISLAFKDYTCRNWENGAVSPRAAIYGGAYFRMNLGSVRRVGRQVSKVVETLVARIVTFTRPPVRRERSNCSPGQMDCRYVSKSNEALNDPLNWDINC
jgi:hypothetical protein